MVFKGVNIKLDHLSFRIIVIKNLNAFDGTA